MSSAVWVLAQWEVKRLYKNFLLIGSVLLVLAFFVPSLMVVGRLQEERYTEFVQHNSSLSDQAKSIASYAEVSFTVLVPPPPLFFLNRGLFDKAELAFKASRIEPPQLRSRSSRGSWLDDLFPALDVASLVEMLFSLIPFIFAYGRFSGEKENGTLKILLVNPISRFHLLLGRMIGLAIALIPALLTTGLVCWAYVLLTPFLRSQMLYRDWMAFLAFFAISTLFGMTNLQVAVLVSALTDRSSSTLLCLVGWLLASIVIVPTLGLEITEKVLPSPSTRAGIAEERRLHASALHAYHEAISYALDRDLHIEPLALERPGTQMFMYRYGNQRLGFQRNGSMFIYDVSERTRKRFIEALPRLSSRQSDISFQKTNLRLSRLSSMLAQVEFAKRFHYLSPATLFKQSTAELAATGADALSGYFTDLLTASREYFLQLEALPEFRSSNFFLDATSPVGADSLPLPSSQLFRVNQLIGRNNTVLTDFGFGLAILLVLFGLSYVAVERMSMD